MGNYVSCTLAGPLMKTNKATRVIFPTGEVRQFWEPVNAAEIMLECPNFFLANSQSVNIGRRFSPLSADEELELGNVYLMFPMKRVSSVVSAADMAVYFMAANSAAKRISGGKVRALPESAGGCSHDVREKSPERSESRLSFEGMEEFQVPEFKYRLASCRSRKPALETIREEPVRTR
ncbi:hypothetical protein HS088_TW02G00885 [Tripterygium wilfordii]|uniref:Uncharacterized protein n=1 Tax=Tripterygium wilfordii TaxID=458696 RepID=A0A7J7E0M3_TRIWF|nr:uncharacterized protein LOC120011122 [Tripterygium wilfordii]KAF5751866.1 hypothetical protein HS088_TW02G00885 [Tripterygium wilfordii]